MLNNEIRPTLLETLHGDLVIKHQIELRSVLDSFATQQGKRISYSGDRVSTILIGEEHITFADMIANLGLTVNPGVIIYEALGPFCYDPLTKQLNLPQGRQFGVHDKLLWKELLSDDDPAKLKALARVSQVFGIPIVGADLSVQEKLNIAASKGAFDIELRYFFGSNAHLDLCNEERESQMLSVINSNRGTLINPAFIVLGLDHALPIRDMLSDVCFIEMSNA